MSTVPINVPRAVITLDRPRTITLQIKALQRLKDATGSFDMQLTEDALFERAPTLIWCTLVDGDREDLTPADVEAMLHAGNINEVVEALGQLTTPSFPKGAEGNALPVPVKIRRRAKK